MPHSLYVHIPFCRHRCAYCDFNTYARQEQEIPAYVTALCREATYVGARAPDDLILHTIFFGGGTPSLLFPSQIRAIVQSIYDAFEVTAEAEITLEANPGTVGFGDLQSLRQAGINRLSLGVQSANGEELRLLERQHSYRDVLDAIVAARRTGFENLNLDLIYGLPEQTLATWQTTVKRILDLRPEHVSAYALTLEHGTPFGAWARRGLLPLPDPDLAADMYEWASSELETAGYSQYEISNWARAGRECRHNLQYWRGLPYLGLGAGAHGYSSGYRYSNVLGIRNYVWRMVGRDDAAHADGYAPASAVRPGGVGSDVFPLSPAAADARPQTPEDEIAEFMIMGLRLTREGIASSTFRDRFDGEMKEVFGREIEELRALGLVDLVGAVTDREVTPVSPAHLGEVLRLSRRGRLLGNQVFKRFVN